MPKVAQKNDDDFLDLNEYVRGSCGAVFYITVTGNSLTEYGIVDSDVLVANRTLQPKYQDIVIVETKGEFFVRRYQHRDLYLISDLILQTDFSYEVWGVVTHVLHKLR